MEIFNRIAGYHLSGPLISIPGSTNIHQMNMYNIYMAYPQFEYHPPLPEGGGLVLELWMVHDFLPSAGVGIGRVVFGSGVRAGTVSGRMWGVPPLMW